MTKRRRRKCLNCGRLFRPDPRNRRHRRYCSAPDCRKASKAVSQARWLSKPQNRDYFCGPEHGGCGCGRGGRPTRATLAEGVRYKRTHRRKALMQLEKQAP